MESAIVLRPTLASYLARVVSDLFSPPALAVPGLLLGVAASPQDGTYRYALVYLLVAVLLPVLYVLWALKTGRISDFHLADRRERRGPFLVSLGCGGAGFALAAALGAPSSLLGPVAAAVGRDPAAVLDLAGLAGQRAHGHDVRIGHVCLSGLRAAGGLVDCPGAAGRLGPDLFAAAHPGPSRGRGLPGGRVLLGPVCRQGRRLVAAGDGQPDAAGRTGDRGEIAPRLSCARFRARRPGRLLIPGVAVPPWPALAGRAAVLWRFCSRPHRARDRPASRLRAIALG